jgi:hypothetical protein
MSDHWDNGHYAHCIVNCAFLLYLDVFIRLPETVQIDLGTDAKHCFCKAGDLLAVVEWYLWISANFEKTYSLQRGSQFRYSVSVKFCGIFRLFVLK